MTQQQHINAIARKHLDLSTLETRKSDRLDFHEVSVWGVEAALNAAFEAGRASADEGASQLLSAASPDPIAALQEHISPEAFVVIAAYLQNAQTSDPDAARQVRWFADRLVDTVGVQQFNTISDELGL